MTHHPARITIFIILMAICFALPISTHAEDAGTEEEEEAPIVEPRSDAVEVLDGRVVIPRPTGWNIAGIGQGAVATFRSASDDRAQIEVRMSSGITEQRWERFWRTFDTDLLQAGFQTHREATRKRYGTQDGLFYEYRMPRSDGDDYVLLVWHTREADRAWVFSIFFAHSRYSAYMRTFEELLSQVTWP